MSFSRCHLLSKQERTFFYFFSPFDVYKPRTNQIGDMRLCEGFTENGCVTTLVVPYVYRKDNLNRSELFGHYGIKTQFNLKVLPTPFWGSVAGNYKFITISILNALYFLYILAKHRQSLNKLIVMSRNQSLVNLFVKIRRLFGANSIIVNWVHEVKFNKRSIYSYKNADAVIGTNSAITNDIHDQLYIEKRNLFVSLNPITADQLKQTLTKEAARNTIGYKSDLPLVVYTGKLFIYQKETELIIDAAQKRPEFYFLFTGGKSNVVKYYQELCKRRKINNCIFTGYIHDYTKMRHYQQAADILLSYYTKDDHAVKYNLPNKICEYMLTGNPIITPFFPALQDTLNDSNAVFVEPENADALAMIILKTWQNYDLAKKKAEQALNDVKEMTFEKRTKLILNFLESLNENK